MYSHPHYRTALVDCSPVAWRRVGAATADLNVMMPAGSTCGPAAHRAPRARPASAASLQAAVSAGNRGPTSVPPLAAKTVSKTKTRNLGTAVSMFAQLRLAQLAADWHEDAWAKGFLGGTPYRDQLDKWAIDYMGGDDVRDSSLGWCPGSTVHCAFPDTHKMGGRSTRLGRCSNLCAPSLVSLAFSLAPVSSFAMPLLLSRPRPLLCAR